MSKEYLKIWFEDIETASEFFEGNEKHLGEFLLNVYREYAGLSTSFRCKQVEKYFKTYRKQIGFIKNAKLFGNKGWKENPDNQQIKEETLRGSLKGGSEGPLDQRLKVKSKKNKERIKKEFIPPSLEEFKKYFKEQGYNESVAERAWKGYDAAGWNDTTGKPVLSWKQKCQNVWFKPENKTTEVKRGIFG